MFDGSGGPHRFGAAAPLDKPQRWIAQVRFRIREIPGDRFTGVAVFAELTAFPLVGQAGLAELAEDLARCPVDYRAVTGHDDVLWANEVHQGQRRAGAVVIGERRRLRDARHLKRSRKQRRQIRVGVRHRPCRPNDGFRRPHRLRARCERWQQPQRGDVHVIADASDDRGDGGCGTVKERNGASDRFT